MRGLNKQKRRPKQSKTSLSLENAQKSSNAIGVSSDVQWVMSKFMRLILRNLDVLHCSRAAVQLRQYLLHVDVPT